jgi:hypothetical protein
MNALTGTLFKRITNLTLAFVVATGTLSIVGPYVGNASALPPTGTITVQGNTTATENTEGWMFNRDVTTSTPFEFNADQAVIGLGSLYVAPISGSAASDKFIGENFLLSNIADVNSVSFDYKIGAGGVSTDFDQIYMNVYANFGSSSATKFYDCRYNVLATSGSTSDFTTLTFDTDAAYSVTTRAGGDPSPFTCPAIPSGMNALSANSTIRAFSINVGDTTLGDAGIDAYLDNVVVNSTSGLTTYDFEPTVPACSSDDTTFDTFSNGSVNGQGGWESTGPFDQAIVTNDYGITSFGCKSFRLSNAVTSGSFGDQTFSYSTPNEAGEADSTNGGKSGGTRVNHYEAQFDIASTQATQQAGLSVSVSPDRGDGSRMSYLQFVDVAGGIEVYFYDVQETGFEGTLLTTLDRNAHTIKFVMDFNDGPSNDEVSIYIDGVLVHTGTSWEDYYRFDPESIAEQTPRTSDSLLFRVAGTAAPATLGNGFLFDNVVITTSDTTVVIPEQPTDEDDETTTGGSTTPNVVTIVTPIITGPASVLGDTNNSTDEGSSDVEGTTDDKTATADTSKDGLILGLAWYWWILILAGATGLTWWIAAAYRRRNNEE